MTIKNSKSRRIVIDPVTRVEGHGKITLIIDEQNNISEARFHVVEFRGFEKFIQGRPYWEVPYFVQRLCGICPVSHHLAAAKAVDQIVGVECLTPTAEKLRKLLHFGQILQSHALHFFHLSSPDLLFGFGADVKLRNIIAVIEKHPELALKGVKLRKYGQQIIEMISGKRVHGAATVPGGMNKALNQDQAKQLLSQIEDVINWSIDAVELNKSIHEHHSEHHQFARIKTHYMGLIKENGALEMYHGGLRVKKDDGSLLFDQMDYRNYREMLKEQVRSWSYMKFPFLQQLGDQQGWYRVGPLARINNCDFISTPLAEQARQVFIQYGDNGIVHDTLAYHWARMIEVLHCAESIKELLLDKDILGNDLVVVGERQNEGIGVIEAPRGTLFHHYKVNEDGLVEKANLIVSTTSNNQAMNDSIRVVANHYLNGNTLTEGLLNHLEVAIRAYDPCLSCATHALGKMPLQLELINQQGDLIDSIEKSASC